MTNEYHTNKNMNTWYIFELLKYILYHQIKLKYGANEFSGTTKHTVIISYLCIVTVYFDMYISTRITINVNQKLSISSGKFFFSFSSPFRHFFVRRVL